VPNGADTAREPDVEAFRGLTVRHRGRTGLGNWRCGDGTVKMWNTEDGRLLRTLHGETGAGAVMSVAFGCDGRLTGGGVHSGGSRSVRLRLP
jgi:WD40 repeat protein